MHIICVLIYQTPMFKHMGSNTYHFSTFYFCFPNLQDCPVSILGFHHRTLVSEAGPCPFVLP